MHFIEVLCPATHFIETFSLQKGQAIPGIIHGGYNNSCRKFKQFQSKMCRSDCCISSFQASDEDEKMRRSLNSVLGGSCNNSSDPLA